MNKVSLEMRKLLGFRIVAGATKQDARQTVISAKKGVKIGDKKGVKISE